MKRISLLKRLAVIFSAAGILLIAAGILLQHIASGRGYTGNVMNGISEFDPPRELVVITASMPVDVRYGDTEKVTVSYTGGLPLIFSEEKGMLRITQDDTFAMTLFSPSAENTGVTVILPHRIYARISISSSSGALVSESLGADMLEFSTKSGDMRLLGIDERAQVRTESGQIYAEFSAFNNDMTINAGAGDVTLIMPEQLSGYLEYITDSGSFTSGRFDEKFIARYGDAAAILGTADSKLSVTTTSGDLYIY